MVIRATRQRRAITNRAHVLACRSVSTFGIATTTDSSSPLMLSAKDSQQAGTIHVLSSKPSFHGMSRTFFLLIRSFPERRSDTCSLMTTLHTVIPPRLQNAEYKPQHGGAKCHGSFVLNKQDYCRLSCQHIDERDELATSLKRSKRLRQFRRARTTI